MASPLEKPLLIRLLEFLIRPTYLPLSQQPPRQILTEILQLFCFNLLVNILLAIGMSWLPRVLGLKHSLSEWLQTETILFALFWVVILAPLVEEILFRAFLRPAPLNLVAPLYPLLYINGASLLIVAQPVLTKLRSFISRSLFQGIYALMILLICVGIYLLVRRRFNLFKAEQFYTKNIGYLFYFASLTFGLMHAYNLDGIENYFYIAPLVTLPQLVSGLVLGYVRIVYGFQWAWFLHALHNAYLFLPLSLVYLLLGSLPNNAFKVAPGASPTTQQGVAGLLLLLWILGTLIWSGSTSSKLLQEAKDYRQRAQNRSE